MSERSQVENLTADTIITLPLVCNIDANDNGCIENTIIAMATRINILLSTKK